MHQERNDHIPVLLEPVLQYLDPKNGERYLDLTVGYGGHARKVCRKLCPGCFCFGVCFTRYYAYLERITRIFQGHLFSSQLFVFWVVFVFVGGTKDAK